MQQAGPPAGDTPDYLDSKAPQHEQPEQQELSFPQPLGNDIYKDGDGADLDLAQDGGGDGFSGGMDSDKGNKTARALELQEKNRSGTPYRYAALGHDRHLYISPSRKITPSCVWCTPAGNSRW